MTATIASLAVEITGDTRGLDRALTRAERGVKGFGKDLGRGMADVGASMGLLISPLVGIGAMAIGASIEFETAFANVAKTVSGTDEELAALRDTLRDLATGDSPVASLDNALITLTNIATIAGSLGVPTQNIAAFAETVALLDAASDDLDAETAATFIGQFQNVTGMDFSEIDELADTVVTLGNQMATTEGEIVSFATRLAPLANFKWEEKDIIAYSAALASLGVSPELGATNLSKTVMDLNVAVAAGGEPLRRFAEAAGLTADEFAALATADPEGAFNKFIEGLSTMDGTEQLQTLQRLGITSNEQISTIMRLAGGYGTLTTALDIADTAWKGNGAAMDEALAKSDTTQGVLNELNNQLYDLKVSVGDALTDGIRKVAEALTPVIGKVTEWAQQNPETVQTIAAVTLAVGGLSAGLVVLGTVIGATTTVFGAFATVVGAVSLPVVTLIAGIALLVTTAQRLLPGMVESWGKAFAEIGKFIQTVIDKIQALLGLLPAMGEYAPQGGALDDLLATRQPGNYAPSQYVPGGGLPGHAAGLSFVPRNDYAASLHKGERVLSAQENRAYNGGGRGGVTVNINGGIFADGEQSLIERIKTGLMESGY